MVKKNGVALLIAILMVFGYSGCAEALFGGRAARRSMVAEEIRDDMHDEQDSRHDADDNSGMTISMMIMVIMMIMTTAAQ